MLDVVEVSKISVTCVVISTDHVERDIHVDRPLYTVKLFEFK